MIVIFCPEVDYLSTINAIRKEILNCCLVRLICIGMSASRSVTRVLTDVMTINTWVKKLQILHCSAKS